MEAVNFQTETQLRKNITHSTSISIKERYEEC